jgi:acyl-CoA oxidase
MGLAARIENKEEWAAAFRKEMEYIHGDCHYKESAAMLHRLVKSGVLRFTDLQQDPERFFEAHRILLAPNRIAEGSGFGVRFTVQFNLFAGR